MSNVLSRSLPNARNWVLPVPALLSVLRIMTGLLFLEHGTGKLLGFPAGLPFVDKMPPGLLYFTGTMELVGGVLITLGLFTRPVAFILSGEMAVAYFQFHAPQAFWPTTNLGAPAILYCFIFLYLVFAGAGEWSLDAMIARSRGERVGGAAGS